MAYEAGELKIFNPSQEISKEIILEILIRHRDALKQARTGELVGVQLDKLIDNDRKMYQARALNLIVAAQREMITVSRPLIYFNSIQKWKKKYKEEVRDENPFEEEENDYNKMKEWLEFLRHCENAILNAERTKTLDDDFLVTKNAGTHGEEINELTQNFYDMVDDLESSYEQIYLLMLTNKIVSAGIEEDEELTYKQKEEEMVRRVVDA